MILITTYFTYNKSGKNWIILISFVAMFLSAPFNKQIEEPMIVAKIIRSIILFNKMNRENIDESTRLAREGQVSKAIQCLEMQLEEDGPTYPICTNLSALYLQLGQFDKVLSCCEEAIICDPYSYPAYYNRFLCYFAQKNLLSARKELHKALSCLYVTRGFEDRNIKYLNRSIYFCEQNARAYLVRGKLNEGKNNKLAQNDYATAIQYDPKLAEIYQQRALFYRKINKTDLFESDLATYMKLKHRMNRPLMEMQDNESQEETETHSLEEEIREFQNLLLRKNSKPELSQSADRGSVSGLPMSSKIETPYDDLLLEDKEMESTQTITIKKQEIQFKKRHVEGQIDKNFKEIFQDENSRDLDEKINRLENQIRRDGGAISEARGDEQMDISDPSNFLTDQIQKAIQEISKLGSGDLNDVKSVKSAASGGSLVGSIISEGKELSPEEFAKMTSGSIEIVSLQNLQDKNRKQTCKVVISYGEKTWETSMKKCDWRETFSFVPSFDVTEIQVRVIQKGGVFYSQNELGEGTINLLQPKIIKCVLGNRQKKVALLYFKVKLS